ncbi:MAG: tetratricopeptide repeat protein [Candidatus Korobacteraceae bacterium]
MSSLSSLTPSTRQAAEPADSSHLRRRVFLGLATVALVYAFLAGLRLVSDSDLGWQLATGRWVAQHHRIFSTDVFSYTAAGRPWIYPVGSGLLFYWAYLLGGYAVISWIGAAACVGTVALLLRRGSAFSAAIAIVAIPLIAARTIPRSDMFTVVLFAAFLSLLWQHYETNRAPLWCLPLLMLAWVNLHLGFIAGLGLIVAFVGLDILEMLFSGTRRREAIQRLKQAIPWFIGTAAATLANPWGWGIYRAIVRQNRAMALHSQRIAEWASARWSWSAPLNTLSPRDPKNTFTFLLAIVVIAAVLAVLQRRPGAAILLAGAMYATVRYLRMEALAACIVIVVGGAVLSAAVPPIRSWFPNARIRSIAAATAVILLVALAVVRSGDLVTNRYYLASGSESIFGAGLSWWFPQHAAEFVERENLPGEIYNTYDDGGYLLWKLGPKYRDYFDGRAIPFGTERFEREGQLLAAPIDSLVWLEEADRFSINTLILPFASSEFTYDQLKDFCSSTKWRPVYLDDVAMVMVRRKPETEDLIQRFEVSCPIAPLPGETLDHSAVGFQKWLNTAYMLQALDRTSEALAASDKALAIFPDSPRLRWVRSNLLYERGRRAEAEQEWLAELALTPGDASLRSRLAELYEEQGRISEATQQLQKAIQMASNPAVKPGALVRLARLYLTSGQPKMALQALDEAAQSASPEMLITTKGRGLKFDIAQGRAAAWRALGDMQKATTFEEEAVQLDPNAADAWNHLAKMYQQQGRTADQQRAQTKADALRMSPQLPP